MSGETGTRQPERGWASRLQRRRGFVWALIIAISMPLVFLLFIAILDAIRGEDVADAPAQAQPLSEIVESPEAYLGQTITTGGEISEVVSPQAVVIGEAQALGGSELLVASADPIAASNASAQDDRLLREGDLVRVTGNVALLRAASLDGSELSDEYRFLVREPAFERFEGQPVLLLELIRRNS